MKYIVDLKDVNLSDLELVGGKNASTGEMLQNLSKLGVKVPIGFATTTLAFREFLAQDGLDKKIHSTLAKLKPTNISKLNKVSADIRKWIMNTSFNPEFEKEILKKISKYGSHPMAVRSSAICEDLPNASFAGQQESFLNVTGTKNILRAIKAVFASLFTSRAIAYRNHQKFQHEQIAISVGVQPMVRSDKGSSGVMFTLDTESGFDKVIFITASYGLGEAIVLGEVNPDEYYVYKPLLAVDKFSILQRKLGHKTCKTVFADGKNMQTNKTKTISVSEKERLRYCLSDKDIEKLARYALLIEKHYGKPMDIEWAKDGISGDIFIVQARPETVKSGQANATTIDRYKLAKHSKILATGRAVGQKIGAGTAKILMSAKDSNAIKPGDVLVTDMTDPDWEPIMKNASAIVTNRGGRTCHAAIIARELGIPAVVGCNDATKRIKNRTPVTVSCAEGEMGHIYEGKLKYTLEQISIKDMPNINVKICINIGNPDKAFSAQFLPNHGVGLARLEFIISDMIGIHPNAILNFQKLPKTLQKEITKKTAAYSNPKEYYIERLREGISMIAAAFYPKQVIFRFSDFKTNEYANLLGGKHYEPHEENPMIGYRGASRYRDKNFAAAFEMECQAIKRTRDMGLTNAHVMVPFVRTVKELREVISIIEKFGLKRTATGLKIYMMCEIPSNAMLAEEFLEHVDGFSIGSNDMTQLVLGLDRDSNLVADLFDERDEAVKRILSRAIKACNKVNKYSGICGQGPSDHPDFAEWLMRVGIQNISLNPDTIVSTWMMLANKSKRNHSQDEPSNKQFECQAE